MLLSFYMMFSNKLVSIQLLACDHLAGNKLTPVMYSNFNTT